MVALAVAMGIGRFVYTPILPGMMEQLGLSATDAGFIASANYLGYLVGAFLAGGGWAQGREKAAMLGGLGATGLLAVTMGLTDSLPVFLATRFLAGLASAFVMVFLSGIVLGRLASAGRNDLQAVHFGGVGLGIAASAVMMSLLFVSGAEWQAGWLWSGAVSIVGFAAVAWLVGGETSVASRDHVESRLPRNVALAKIILAYGLFGFGYIVTATFLVAIIRHGGSGRMFETMVWLAAGLAAIPSVWLWNRIAARMSLTTAFALGCIAEAVGVTASVSLGGHIGPLLGGILLGGTFIAITAFGLQAGFRFAPKAPRRIFAAMTMSFGIGQILGPIAAGLIAESTGSFFAPSLGAALALLVAAAISLSAGPAINSP